MSLKEIALLTGLSISTVSHALNGTRQVSEKSRKSVLAAAIETNYRPNMVARALRTQRSNVIALVIPNSRDNPNASYFYMDIIMGVRKRLVEVEYELLVTSYEMHSPGKNGLEALQVFRKQWIDGVILVPSTESDKQINLLQKDLHIPFVLLDRRVNNIDCSCIDSDNAGGAQDAVMLLASCARKRIGYIGGCLGSSTNCGRLNGYKKAIATLGWDLDESLIQLHNTFSVKKGVQSAKELINNGADAIFVADNTMMMGVVRYLDDQGIAIPERIALIGFDDFGWMEFTHPPLTTICQQSLELGYIAADMLLLKIGGISGNERITVSTSLILRKSHCATPLTEL